MARKSRKAEQLKQELISSVPVEQRKMITQPVTFTYLNGEMTMMQARIQTMIMEKLQAKIKKALERKMVQGFFGDLFDQADYKPLDDNDRTNYLCFKVDYSELGIEPSHYSDVDVAARAMQRIVYEKEVNGYIRNIVAFSVIDVPDPKKGERHTDIKLYVTESVAKDIFDLQRLGYHKYLKDAIFLFSSNYAGRIYLLINANKYLGTWVCPYEKLRKILLTTYDPETKTASSDKYRDINDFKKRVLEPARKEIQEAADRVDCTFDYEFQYPAGKRRGTPEAVVFHIHLTDLGRNISKKRLESKDAKELHDMLVGLRFSATEADNIISQMDGRLKLLLEKVREQEQFYADAKAGLHPDVKSPRAYVLQSIRNFIAEQTGIVAGKVPSVAVLQSIAEAQPADATVETAEW